MNNVCCDCGLHRRSIEANGGILGECMKCGDPVCSSCVQVVTTEDGEKMYYCYECFQAVAYEMSRYSF